MCRVVDTPVHRPSIPSPLPRPALQCRQGAEVRRGCGRFSIDDRGEQHHDEGGIGVDIVVGPVGRGVISAHGSGLRVTIPGALRPGLAQPRTVGHPVMQGEHLEALTALQIGLDPLLV